MDWVDDDACLSGKASSDLLYKFKYQPHPSRVIKIVERNCYRAQVSSLQSPRDWTSWLENNIDYRDRGLILILADRAQHDSSQVTTNELLSIEDWLAKTSDPPLVPFGRRRATTCAPLGEKSSFDPSNYDSVSREGQQPRSLRRLPFSQGTFEQICEKFQVHRSIVRAIARSDVPVISCDRVHMNAPAIVYNCRTPNSWASDMALSATHYPRTGLTLGILYGSTFAVEKTMLRRLQSVGFEAAHPMLLPGLCVELELARHTQLIENSANKVETKIFELNFQSGNVARSSRIESEKRNIEKRTAWLDLTYLRNSVTTWSTQLLKIVEHTESLNKDLYNDPRNEATRIGEAKCSTEHTGADFSHGTTPIRVEERCQLLEGGKCDQSNSRNNFTSDIIGSLNQLKDVNMVCLHEECKDLRPQHCKDTDLRRRQMQKVGMKIISRIAAICDEYEEKIRDCTMRVDGMAMATQWSHSETAVEIALATNQDSRVMRSISLVTMVFLPGTFFATVFSMTFFNWSEDSSKARVSSYLWIYVVVTVFFTGVTIGLWYFFVMSRRAARSTSDVEKLHIS